MPVGRHQGSHDHRRLSSDGKGDRPSGRLRARRGRHRRRTCEIDDAELARRAKTATVFARIMPEQKLRIVNALQGQWRDRGDDRRWRQRCAVAEGGPYRHRHGRSRNGRGAGSVGDRAARRRFWLDRQGDPAGPAHLRQFAQGHEFHLCRSRADCGPGAVAAAVRPTDPVRADPYRLSRNGHRSRLLAGVRGRDRGGRRHAPPAARSRHPACFRAR